MRQSLFLFLLIAVWSPVFGHTPEGLPFPHRTVIHAEIKTDEFAAVVEKFQNPVTSMIPDSELQASGIYFRLINKRFVMDSDGKFTDKAHLAASPYIFITVPQAGFGRSLYGIYSDVGYDAASVLKQRGVRMTAVLFRYTPEIQLSPEMQGQLPENFKSFIYVPVWDNAFALLRRLAAEEQPAGTDNLLYLQLSDQERDLARFYPPSRLRRISVAPYAMLRAFGGPDWDYRQLLESKMGMNEHFRGVGITENTLSPVDNRKGLPEFVGPNRTLSALAEYAVIDLGHMEFVEVHDN